MSSSLLRKLSLRPTSARYSERPSGHITPAPDLSWERVGPEVVTFEALLQQLEKIYWDGMKNELEVILLTLKRWQEAEYSSVLLDDETDDFVHGFDTFIDQVSQQSRAFADRYGKSLLVMLITYIHMIRVVEHKLTIPKPGRKKIGSHGMKRIIRRPYSIRRKIWLSNASALRSRLMLEKE